MSMPAALTILDTHYEPLIYGPEEKRDIASLVRLVAPPQTRESVARDLSVLREVEVILSGWGAPCMDASFLAAAPRLGYVCYGAGSIRGVTTDAFWDRGVRISSAWSANAVPVAEYAFAQILFCLKLGWPLARAVRASRAFVSREAAFGAYGSTAGIVSLGMVGRRVCELLKVTDLRVIAYDPFASAADAAEAGVTLVDLDELFMRADVVSLHTPWLPETENMIRGRHFRSMKRNAAFINTARGAVVNEPEMIEVLSARPDLQAVLDVTHPEPPPPDSPLYTLPNVIVTPHIAGSVGLECRRHGRYMVEELRRYLAGEPLRWEVSRERSKTLA
jgi:phosphoglycerate dehydrogenase-like enzyme